MTTVTSGQYQGCPINRLPTGYIVFAVNNNVLKPHHREFFDELTKRLFSKQEPAVDETVLDEPWFDDWDDKVKHQYVSMITDGAWQWSGDSRRAINMAHQLEQAYISLLEVYLP